MAELSDELIMYSVKQGNLSDLAELFERYHIRLYNYFLKLTFDKAISQDLTQNLFYRVMKYRNTFRADSKFKPWIYQMARNVHFDHCNEKKRKKEQTTVVEKYENNICDQCDGFSEEEFETLDKALAKLNTEQRELIVLARFQSLSYEEISKINGTTVGAIKVQMHRAIKQLRELYFKQELN